MSREHSEKFIEKAHCLIMPIKGMHCRSCEMLIEEKLKTVEGVKEVEVSFKKGLAAVGFDARRPARHDLEQAVRAAGYEFGKEDKKTPFIKLEREGIKDLSVALVFLFGAYKLAQAFNLTSLSLASSASSVGVAMPLLVGLTAGVSTCMALVGGLVLGMSARHAEIHPEATAFQKFRPHLFFNLGRIASYTVLGGVLGALGSIFQLSNLTLGLLTMAVGLVMIILGLQLIEIFPWVERWKLMLPKSLGRRLGLETHHKEYSHRGAMLMGALTFFLPCGFTQSMQLYAMSSGSLTKGAVIMGLFALGTAPGLLGVGGLTSVIKGTFARRFFKFAGIVVVLLAVFNLSNGWRLTGWSLPQATAGGSFAAQDPNVTLENGVQIVRMEQGTRGYSPNRFTIRKGVPVRWVINSTDPYSCASSISFPAFKIRKFLNEGENVLEFTPQQVGTLRFTCAMGMYAGTFTVVDSAASGAAAPNPSVALAAEAPTQKGPGCGGGGGGCGGGCGGGQRPPTVPVAAPAPTIQNDAQVIRATYTVANDIQPNTFTVKRGRTVRFEVDVNEDGYGCMSSILVPGLTSEPLFLEGGKTLTMNFTPTKTGTYPITCAMGVERGSIIVEN